MNNTRQKELKFQKLANNRSNRIIKDLMLLGNLSNRNNYKYNEEQVKEMFSKIDEAYDLAKNRFEIEFKKRKLS
jgi:hypothetical protein